jgi:hexokinase
MPCRITAILNDTVGVLAASCYHDQATEMGIILGTGTNACITLPVSSPPELPISIYQLY